MTHGSPQELAGKRNNIPSQDGAPQGCRHCGGSLKALRPGADFCSVACRSSWWVTARNRGGQAYALLLDWRLTRGTKKRVLGDLAHLVDGWIRQDREKANG